MTDHPILFSAPMIRALIDGRKTQTRRLLKPQPDTTSDPSGLGQLGVCNRYGYWRPIAEVQTHAPGDRLWVREAWSGEHVFSNIAPASRPVGLDLGHGHAAFRENIWYWADGGPDFGDWERPRPSIHMPRWASRLTLSVTDVRVQRLQDISEEDAVAEGVSPIRHEWWQGFVRHPDGSRGMRETVNANEPPPANFEYPEKQAFERSARDSFAELWNSLHGPGAWDANPWVCAISFDVHRCNIDQMEGAE